MKYLLQLSDWCGSVIDFKEFTNKSKAVLWAREQGRNAYAHLWDYENQTLLKEWKIKG